jgi:NADPH:quinone reductase-like Zn-dependent oxidoreductase
MAFSMAGAAKVISGVAGGAAEAQSVLKDLIEAGKLRTVIDRRYSLDQISDAHRYADAEHKRGHVVILVERTVPRR